MSIASHGLEEGRDYELTIGSSFLTGKAKEAYHLMRYDFKPASIDTSRPAEFVVGENNQCTVTIPNIQDSGNTTTTYKGGKKPCTKECVLIIDKETGQITLERITSSIPLKKCRADKSEKKSIVQGKPIKETSSSQSTSKASKSTHPNPSTVSATSTLNTPSSSTPTPASAIHNPISSTSSISSVHSSTVSSNSSSKINTNPPNASATIPKKRLMSGMSVSSTSSDSSDSDSGDEEEDPLANQLESTLSTNPPSKSVNGAHKSSNPPPKSVNPPPKSTNPPPKSTNPPPKSANLPSKSSNPPMKSVNPLSKSTNPPPKSAHPPPKSANPPPKPASQLSKPANPLPKSERPPATKMETNTKSDRSSAPPVKVATVKSKEKSFLSTLQSDLQLSDSNSDSD